MISNILMFGLKRAWCMQSHISKWRTIQRMSDYGQKLGCQKCNCEWAINHDVRIALPWSWEFELFYSNISPAVSPVSNTGQIVADETINPHRHSLHIERR